METEGSGLAGYVLLLADVTESVDAEAKRVALFQRLVEGTRAGLANIRAASENLAAHPGMEEGRRARFAGIIQDEAVRLSELVHATTADASERLKVRWPLEEMRGEDLLTLARRRIERRLGLATKLESVDPDLWLRVDSFSLAQGLGYLARRLQDEFAVREVRFRLLPAGGHAQLDMLWRGAPLGSETAFAWQNDPFTLGGEDSPLTLAQVMERHGGETWYQRDLPAQLAYFRLLLPLAEGRRGSRGRAESASRPEFYDFDLFRRSPASEALDERRLEELAYTVFDTETTGPQSGRGRRDHRDRRGPDPQRPPARGGDLRVVRRPAAEPARGVGRGARDHARHARRAADDRRGAAPVSGGSRRTRSWSGTTLPSTCAFSS